MLKKGDNDDNKADDDVRTTVPLQNHPAAILNTEELFLRTQYL
jgi:hypothetical protein